MICILMILNLFGSQYVDLQRGFKISVLEGYQVTAVHNQNPFLYIGKDLVHRSYPNLNIVQAEPTFRDPVKNSAIIVEQLEANLTEYSPLKQEKFVFQDSDNALKLYGQWKLKGRKQRCPMAKRKRKRQNEAEADFDRLTVLIRPRLLQALREAAMTRRREREFPFTQQDIVGEAIEAWLRKKGFLE